MLRGRGLIIYVLICHLAACEQSPFGPQIEGRDYEEDASEGTITVQSAGVTPHSNWSGVPSIPDSDSLEVTSTGNGTSNNAITDDITSSETATPSSVSSLNCSWYRLRTVFYGNSQVEQIFSCPGLNAGLGLLAGAKPTFLTAAVASELVTFSGVAPATASNNSWSFSFSGIQTTGDAQNISTVVLSPTTLVPTLAATSVVTTAAGSNSNGVELRLEHQLSLDNSWDGSMNDVSLVVTQVETDIPHLTLLNSCSHTGSYLCPGGMPTVTDKTIDSNLRMKWSWSAFDQGEYFVQVRSRATIESGINALADADTTMTVPMQPTGGNKVLVASNSLTWSSANDASLRYDAAFSSASVPDHPVVGVLYMGISSGVRAFVLQSDVDRSVPPTGQAVAISSATRLDTRDSQDFSLQSIAPMRWVAVGGAAGNATYDVVFTSFDSSWNGSNPPPDVSVTLSSYSGTSNRALWIDTSQPFSSVGKTYVGIGYVRLLTNPDTTTTSYVTVLKANVDGTSNGTILDDSDFDLSANASGHTGSSATIDRLRLEYHEESGVGYFYLAYREGSAIKVSKLRAVHSNTFGYDRLGPVSFAAGLMTSDSSSGTAFAWQSVDLTLNTSVMPAIPVVVYRDKDGNCWLQHAAADLTAVAAPVALTSQDCRNPTVHYNAAANVYVVTYAERVASGTAYEIKTVEVIPGTNDTAGTPMVVVAGLNTFPSKLTTRLYAEGHWMAIVYRLNSSNQLILHGYHVRGRP